MYAIYPEFKIELDILHQNPIVPKVSLSLMNRTDLKLLQLILYIYLIHNFV